MKPQVLKVLVVQSTEAVRASLRFLLENMGGVRVECVAECATADEALERAPGLGLGLVLAGLLLEGTSGLGCARRLRTVEPKARIVLVTGVQDLGAAVAAYGAGAAGYVLKPASSGELQSAIRGALAGRFYLSAAVAAKGASSSLIDPRLAFPDYLTDRAFDLWRPSMAEPAFWFALAARAHYRVGELHQGYGRSLSQTKLDWPLCFGCGAKRWLERAQFASILALTQERLRTARIAEGAHLSSTAALSHFVRRLAGITLEQLRLLELTQLPSWARSSPAWAK